MGTRESLNGRKNVARRNFFVPYIFFRPFRLSLAPTICPWVSEDGKYSGRKKEGARERETRVSLSRPRVVSCAHYFQKPATKARYTSSKSRNFTDAFTGEAQLAPTTQTSVNFRHFEALYQTLYQTWQIC